MPKSLLTIEYRLWQSWIDESKTGHYVTRTGRYAYDLPLSPIYRDVTVSEDQKMVTYLPLHYFRTLIGMKSIRTFNCVTIFFDTNYAHPFVWDENHSVRCIFQAIRFGPARFFVVHCWVLRRPVESFKLEKYENSSDLDFVKWRDRRAHTHSLER